MSKPFSEKIDINKFHKKVKITQYYWGSHDGSSSLVAALSILCPSLPVVAGKYTRGFLSGFQSASVPILRKHGIDLKLPLSIWIVWMAACASGTAALI
jgi:hypothetical protein